MPLFNDLDGLRTRLAKLLLEKSYREGDFLLTSGKKTDYYFDCKQTALHPEGGMLMGALFLALLTSKDAGVIDGVGGMTLGADPLVSAVSVMSQVYTERAAQGAENALFPGVRPLPACIIRKQPKGHGTNQFLEGLGNFQPGARMALLEDVVTTGGTLLTAVKRVEDAGFNVAGVYCVLDRNEGGAENLRAEGYELRSIFTRKDLLAARKA